MVIKNLMARAAQSGASDLHLVVGLPPSLRLNGDIEFLPLDPLESESLREGLLELITPTQREKLERRKDLEFTYSDSQLGRFRASFYQACGNLEACFRLIPAELPAFESLGLPEVVRTLALHNSGLVLICGATGQGKTTTMNCMIDLINAERRARVVTIEDPIEFVHSNKRSVVIQREVESDTDSFQSALNAALRQDPNVICVGELRSVEAMATALTAAETGHLVLATLHTNSAPSVVERIVDVFPSHQQNQARIQLASSLRGVVCLQLLPRMAEKGRVMACEVMVANHGVRTMIRAGRADQLYNSILTGAGDGMISMDRALRALYERGEVSYDEAVQRAHSPDSFRRLGEVSNSSRVAL